MLRTPKPQVGGSNPPASASCSAFGGYDIDWSMPFQYRVVVEKILRGCYRCLHLVEKVSDLMGHLAGWAFLLLAFYITIDTVLRKYTVFSSKGHTEIGQYVLAVAVTWGAGYALSKRAHIRIDTLLILMPRWLQGYLNLGAIGLVCLFLSAMLWYLLTDFLPYTFRMDAKAATILRTPLKIPQTIWVFGLFWFWLYALLQFIVGLLETGLGRASKLALGVGHPNLDLDTNSTTEA